MIRPWSVFVGCVAASAGFVLPSAAQVPSPPSPIVLENTATPAGGQYTGFSAPVIGGTGTVAFQASITGAGPTANSGLFAGTAGSITAVAVRGGATPSGGTYTTPPAFRDLVVTGTDRVIFRSGVIGLSGMNAGIFSGTFTGIQTVALNGGGSPAGSTYTNISTDDGVALNASGRVAFTADLTGTPFFAVFAGLPGAVQPVAVRGQTAPAGAVGTYIQFSPARQNESNQVAFGARLEDGSGGGGVFLTTTTGTVQTVAAIDTPAPAGGTFSSFGLSPKVTALNAAGQVAFTASVRQGVNTFQDMVVGAPGALQHVGRWNTPAPGGGEYSTFGNPILNAAGQVAFIASVRLTDGSGVIRPTLFVGAPGSVVRVAQQQTDTAPGGGTYFTIGDPALNAAGQVAFFSTLTGDGVSSTNNEGLYAGTPGALFKVVRKGDVIDVDPGAGTDSRTVQDILFTSGSGGGDGLATGFADNGALVYRLTFTDGTSGVFTSVVPVPEPAGLLFAVAASLCGVAARRYSTRKADRPIREGGRVCDPS